MKPAIIGQLHKLQRYCRFMLALTAIIALAMLVVGIPVARAQISKLMFVSTTRVDPVRDRQ
jgi:hypothetical protein